MLLLVSTISILMAAQFGQAADGTVAPAGSRVSYSLLKPEATIRLSAPPAGMLALVEDLVVAGGTRIDRVKADQVEALGSGFGRACGGIAFGFGSYWIPDCGDRALHRVDVATGKLAAKIESGVGPGGSVVAASNDSIWLLADSRTTLMRIDPLANAVVAEIRLPQECPAIAHSDGALWIACGKRVLRVDAASNTVTGNIETPGAALAIAVDDGAIWVLCPDAGKVVRVDAKNVTIAAAIDVGGAKSMHGAIAAYGGYVWVTIPGLPLTKISAEHNRIVQQFQSTDKTGGNLIAATASSVWLAVGNSVLRFDPRRISATVSED